jgi:hypothetical protein
MRCPSAICALRNTFFVPEEAPGGSNLVEDLILRNFASNVASLCANKLLRTCLAQGLVVTIAGTTPFREAVVAVLSVLDRLRSEVSQHLLIKLITWIPRRWATIEEVISPREILGEHLEASGHVSVR